MASFEDDRKRLVSMAGGRAKDRPTNKEAFVRSLREDRERRALEVKREKSAVIIQKRVRGMLARSRERRKAKQEALHKLKGFQEVARVVGAKNPRFAPYGPTVKLIRLVLFAAEPQSQDLARGLLLTLNSMKPSNEEDIARSFREAACMRFLANSLHVQVGEFEALFGSNQLASVAGTLLLRSSVDSSFTTLTQHAFEYTNAVSAYTPHSLAAAAVESPTRVASVVRSLPASSRNVLLSALYDLLVSKSVFRIRLYCAGEPVMLPSKLLASPKTNDAIAQALIQVVDPAISSLDTGSWIRCLDVVISGNTDSGVLNSLCDFRRLTTAYSLCTDNESLLGLVRFLANKVASRSDARKGNLSLKSLCHLAAVGTRSKVEESPVWRLWDALMTMDNTLIKVDLPELDFACGALSLLLDSVDDGMLFLSASPVLLNKLGRIVGYVKQLLFESVWIRVNPKVSDSSALVLFTRLYERCSRHINSGLFPRSAFLFPTVPLNELGLSSTPGATNQVRIGQRDMRGDGEDDDEEDNVMEIVTAQASSRGQLLLRTIPFAIPFDQRVALFSSHLLRHKEENRDNQPRWNELTQSVIHPNRVRVTVKRDTIVDDAFAQLQRVDISGRLQVIFVSDLGLEEAGIDGGGLFKEFITLFCKKAFSPEYGLFMLSPTQQLFPSPRRDSLALLEFTGKMLAKAVYEGILVELSLSPFVLNLARGSKNTVNDLVLLDPELYRNLMRLRTLGDDELSSIGLTFTASSIHGEEVELVPSGRTIPVTKDNVAVFVEQYADFKLNRELKPQIEAFVRGFNDLIEPSWVRLFSPSELEMVIGGTAQGFDVVEMRKHAVYGGGYHPSQPYIQDFWDVVGNEFTVEQRGQLLKFITSCSRPPLTGFGSLDPKIAIYQVRDDVERLPTASTCVNLLKLPKYPSKDILRQKLLTAIESDSGFELS